MGRNDGLNLSYFKNITTKEQAYWLGFLVADGSVKVSGSLQIHISVKDEFHLDRFLDIVGFDKSYKRYYGPYEYSGKSVQVVLGNREFTEPLVALGMIQGLDRKKIPDLSDDLFEAFVSGYYDGDGVSCKSVLLASNSEFLQAVKNRLGIKFDVHQEGRKLYSLSLGRDLKYKLYINYSDVLERKWEDIRAFSSVG